MKEGEEKRHYGKSELGGEVVGEEVRRGRTEYKNRGGGSKKGKDRV